MRLKLFTPLFILLLLAAPGWAESINLTINPLAAEGSPKALATEYLKKLLQERSSARIQVTISHATDETFSSVLEALNRQDIQLALPEIRDLKGTLPMLQIYELPFLFRDRQHLHRVIDNQFSAQIAQGAQQLNLKPLAVWDGATRQLLAGGALTFPGDIPAALIASALSGNPETTQRLDRWLEIQLPEASYHSTEHKLKALTLTNHSMATSVLPTNRKYWDQLPEDLKVIILGAIEDATTYLRELSEQADDRALNELKKNGSISTHPLSSQQRVHWQKVTQRLYTQTLDQEILKIVDTITKD